MALQAILARMPDHPSAPAAPDLDPRPLNFADLGLAGAAKADRALLKGINTYGGHVTCEPVAQAHKMEYVPAAKLLG